MTIDQEADRHVAEMIRLGATFHIVPSGLGGETWVHDCKPGTRASLRSYKNTAGLNRIGMNDAMTVAIRRLQKKRGAA